MKMFYFLGTLLLLMVMVSCTTTRQTVSLAQFNSTVEGINDDIKKAGYRLSGKASEEKNEVVVTGRSYSAYTGYGTLMDNNYYTVDSYKFANDDNQTISYSVKYQVGNGYKDGTKFVYADLIDCNCSDVEKYEEICGKQGVTNRIASMTPDQKTAFYDAKKTYLASFAGTLIGTTALLLLLLPAY